MVSLFAGAAEGRSQGVRGPEHCDGDRYRVYSIHLDYKRRRGVRLLGSSFLIGFIPDYAPLLRKALGVLVTYIGGE